MKHPKSYDSTAETRKRMSHVKLKKGYEEVVLAKALWHKGYRYRLNYKGLPGSPDIAIIKYKVAIFVDGEFWHGYKWDEKKDKIKRNREYWIQKIEEILARKAADFSSKTAIHTQRLFVAYGFDEVFGRSMITKQLGIKEVAVSRLITKLLQADIIEPVSGYGKGKYRFKSN